MKRAALLSAAINSRVAFNGTLIDDYTTLGSAKMTDLYDHLVDPLYGHLVKRVLSSSNPRLTVSDIVDEAIADTKRAGVNAIAYCAFFDVVIKYGLCAPTVRTFFTLGVNGSIPQGDLENAQYYGSFLSEDQLYNLEEVVHYVW
jgi:hypothetical protein